MDQNTTTSIDRIPPQAIDIEKAFIGALLLEGDKFDSIKTFIPEESFYDNRHKLIYSTMRELNKEDGKIDLLTISQKLIKDDKLDNLGGITYLTSLTANVASSAHLKYHASIIYGKWIARELIRYGSEMIENSYTIDDALDYFQQVNNSMNKRILHFLGIQSTGIKIIEAANKSIDDYYIREENIKKGVIAGIPSTLKTINKITGGFQGEQLIILAGRPGMGKTSLAISFMITAAYYKKKSAFFSLEMTSTRLTDKVICSIAEVDHSSFKKGYLTDIQKKSMEASLTTIEQMDVTFNEDMVVNVEQIHATCKTLKDKNGLDIVFIDYLQLMRTSDKVGNREQEISTMSRKCKMMAVDLNVPVILMSQLNRGVESRADKRPVLSDLRESGSIEQDADIVMFIYRECVYDKEYDKELGEVIIAKHREGSTGIVNFKSNVELTKFADYDKENKQVESITEFNSFDDTVPESREIIPF
jgi:replicative DNA helicase